MELTPDFRNRDLPNPDSQNPDLRPSDLRDPAVALRKLDAPYADLRAPDRQGLDRPEGSPNLVADDEERVVAPQTNQTALERRNRHFLLWLVGVSLAAHACILMALVLLEPPLQTPERFNETPVEVVIEPPPPPPAAPKDSPPAAAEKQTQKAQTLPPLAKPQDQKQAEEQKPTAETKAAEDKAAERKAAEQKAAEAKAAEEKAAEQKAAEQKAAEAKAAEEKAAEQKASEQKAAETKAAEEKAAEQKASEQKAAETKAAEEKAAEQKASEQKAAEAKAAEEKAAEQKATEQKAAEQKAAEQKAAESKHAEKKPSPAQAKAAARAAAAEARKEALQAEKQALEAEKEALQEQAKALEARKEAFETNASKSAALDEEAAKTAGNQLNGLPLPYDFGPDHFRAVAVPLPTENGDEPMSYKEIVFGLLERAKQYPHSARDRGASGKAVVGFSINEDGELTNVTLLQTSGDTDLDIESVALVARAAPFPKPPPGAARTFGAEITFGLQPEPLN